MPRTHARAPRECFDRQVGVEVLEHPQFQRAEDIIALLRGQVPAELRLPAGSLEEHHQFLSDRDRSRFAPVRFHHRERHVHSGGDACRGIDVAAAYEDGVTIDLDLGCHLAQLIEVRPMRGGPLRAQHTCACEQQRAGTDRPEPGNLRRLGSYPLQQRTIGELVAIADAASDQQCVSFARLGVRAGGLQAQAAGCLEPAGARCDQLDGIGVVSETAVIAQPA